MGKGLSQATIDSYKTTFRLLLEFLYRERNLSSDSVDFDDFEVEVIIHLGPDYDEAMENIVRALAQIVCDQIDEMHLSVAEIKALRKSLDLKKYRGRYSSIL